MDKTIILAEFFINSCPVLENLIFIEGIFSFLLEILRKIQ
jgi:hypothetical protein